MQIAFIGFGEAGAAIVQGWGDRLASAIRVYDIKTDMPETAGEIVARCADFGVTNCMSNAEALHGADLVFCTVTADQAGAAARAAAPYLGQGAVWLDLNSCSPSTKRSSAEVIEAASARYVDVAVMAPVHPKLNHVPCLMAGPHATEIAAVLADLPMTVRVISGEVGAASSIKMIRSVMIKGLEALTSECVLAAVAAGVEDEVLASLNAGADFDWGARAAYNFDRMIVHGARRAAEMEEVAKTLDDLGLPNDITRSTVLWQRRIADLGLSAPQTPLEDGPVETANTLLSELRRR